MYRAATLYWDDPWALSVRRVLELCVSVDLDLIVMENIREGLRSGLHAVCVAF